MSLSTCASQPFSFLPNLMSAYDKEPTWSTADKAIMGFIVGLHALGIAYFMYAPEPKAEPIPVVLQVSLIRPLEEEPPPPPEAPKPPPPRIQPPQPVPKTPPPIPQELPKVITEVPVANPIPPPPPPPPEPPAPPPPPAPAKPSAPAYLVAKQMVKPTYPRKAMRDGIEGKVTVLITVNEKGLPVEAKVIKSSGNFDLDNAARNAAMKYTFVPLLSNGIPVKAQGLQDFVFNLNEG